MSTTSLRPGTIVTGPLLPEPVEVQVIVPMGDSVKLIGKGMRTGMFFSLSIACTNPRSSGRSLNG